MLRRCFPANTFVSSRVRRDVYRGSYRKCSTTAEKQSGEVAGGKVGASGNTPPETPKGWSYGPQRKDWRTHKDVVYVKGVPVKGSLFKLPLSEQFLIMLVFSLAGTGAVLLVRPQIRYLCTHHFLGLPEHSSWKDGPWLYRLVYCLIMFPCYSVILFCVGGAFGRRIWFSFMIHKMWSRFLPKRASERMKFFLDIQHY